MAEDHAHTWYIISVDVGQVSGLWKSTLTLMMNRKDRWVALCGLISLCVSLYLAPYVHCDLAGMENSNWQHLPWLFLTWSNRNMAWQKFYKPSCRKTKPAETSLSKEGVFKKKKKKLMKSTWNCPSVQLLYIFMCIKAHKYHKPFVQSIWMSQKKFFWKSRSKLQQVLCNSHCESTGGSQGRICQAIFTLSFLLLCF